MKRFIFFTWVLSLMLVGCGGGGGGGVAAGSTTIKASDYALPSALPSVPDQAGK